MNDLPKNLTLFYVSGIFSIIVGIIYTIMPIDGNSTPDGLMGIYILFCLLPVIVLVIIDRFMVTKFGNQKVNIVEFYCLLFMVLLWVAKMILNL